ncbi:FAD-dependent oxidoreductase [Paenibacillus sp. PL2-23]|uniref:glycerol-3-phosphate dehydrogenase/oxidase n=1 Tax=Paenibacillus sp. PL2-23 TaxID=2100729 RepID=UPI0030FA36B5
MTITFSSRPDRRAEVLKRLSAETYDVLIIGGGITGAGIALDASTRGLRAALIEMQDFAGGTSSRSTKLVHGGLRYLKQYEVKMVAEVGKERAVVYENGPHVTTPEWMLLPLYKGGTFGPLSTSFGLKLYDYLAGVKRGERRSMLSANEALAKEPLLKRDGLIGGGYYVEYRTDDARLTLEVLKKAVEHGAVATNYMKAEQFHYENGRLSGVTALDAVTGEEVIIRAKKIVNAAGPWVDSLRELDRSRKGKTLRLTKGVHLVFDGTRFPLQQAVYFDTPDGRMIFAIPRDGKTYAGTTDTDYDQDLVNPAMEASDRDYVLHAVNGMFPGLQLKPEDVESSWAGLRPLIYEEGKSASEVSRKDEIFRSPSGLFTIAGGKLTGYRKMAENVVNMLAKELQAEGSGTFKPCATKHLPISGGEVGGSAKWPAFLSRSAEAGVKAGVPKQEARIIAQRYGANADRIFRLAREDAAAAERHGLPPALYATLLYAIDEEMALRPADFFIRRTGALFFDIEQVRMWKDAVIGAMSELLGYSEAFRVSCERELEARLSEAAMG